HLHQTPPARLPTPAAEINFPALESGSLLPLWSAKLASAVGWLDGGSFSPRPPPTGCKLPHSKAGNCLQESGRTIQTANRARRPAARQRMITVKRNPAGISRRDALRGLGVGALSALVAPAVVRAAVAGRAAVGHSGDGYFLRARELDTLRAITARL